MGRAVILMMDSFGIGGAPDAGKFGNDGADTFGHIAAACPDMKIPNLAGLGLCKASELATGRQTALSVQAESRLGLSAAWGCMREISADKDTVSGHWELAGLPNLKGWGHFPPAYPSFPASLVAGICAEAGLDGILGNKAASGTVIIQELGEEHIATGKPIFYTSADSNLQIAAHQEHFGLERLYELCQIAYRYVQPYNIGRIIARPFIGEKAGSFTRTKFRRDYTAQPFGDTLLDRLKAAGREVFAIGAINDIYAHRGITEEIHGAGLEELWNLTLGALQTAPDNSLILPILKTLTCSGAIAAMSKAMPKGWNISIRVCRRFCRTFAMTICCSLPPTTATTQPMKEPTTPASRCRCSCSAAKSLPAVSDDAPPMPTSVKALPPFWTLLRSLTAKAF